MPLSKKAMETDDIIKARIEAVLPMLNERQARIYLSAEAQSVGWGGKSKIAQLSSVTRRTIAKGETELLLKEDNTPQTRIRKVGGGRRKTLNINQRYYKQ